MKRAKIMLTAIAVLAVVGGALAFKAAKFTPGNVYCKLSNTVCQRLTYTTEEISGAATTSEPCNNSPITTDFFTDAACSPENQQPATTVYNIVE